MGRRRLGLIAAARYCLILFERSFKSALSANSFISKKWASGPFLVFRSSRFIGRTVVKPASDRLAGAPGGTFTLGDNLGGGYGQA